MKVFIFGCGAIGSTLSSIITRYPFNIKEFVLVDNDKVEDRNVTPGTQFFMRSQIGKNKTEALQTNLYLFCDCENTRIFNDWLTPQNWHKLQMEKGDLVIDCFDNADARNMTSQLCKVTNHVLHVAFSYQKTFDIWWDNTQMVKDPTVAGDICEMQGAGGFVKYVCSLGAEVYLQYLQNKKKKSCFGSIQHTYWE